MKKPLKILLLEDNPLDAEIIQRRLLKEKTNWEFFIATNKKIFLQALEEFFPDVILSDNSLPQLNAIEALKLTRRQYPHIPFILVTGTVSPELLVLAVGTGSVFGSHVNDSGFWIFKEFFHLSLKQTFLSWTVMETLISILGLVGVMLLSLLVK